MSLGRVAAEGALALKPPFLCDSDSHAAGWCVSECTIISQQLKRANVTTSGFLFHGNKHSPKTLDSTWLNTISRVQTLTAEVHKILKETYKPEIMLTD